MRVGVSLSGRNYINYDFSRYKYTLCVGWFRK